MRSVLAVAFALLVWSAAAGHVAAQAELDRVVSRVNNSVITLSDIREAMLMKLVEDSTSEDSTRRGLENRMLILAEISRVLPALPPASDGDLAARRAQWESGVGGRARVPDLLGRTSLKENGLEAWLRDDVRIQMHLNRQFGSVPDGDRAKATSDWIARLRQRAGLK